jgi:hypothetical protein
MYTLRNWRIAIEFRIIHDCKCFFSSQKRELGWDPRAFLSLANNVSVSDVCALSFSAFQEVEEAHPN